MIIQITLRRGINQKEKKEKTPTEILEYKEISFHSQAAHIREEIICGEPESMGMSFFNRAREGEGIMVARPSRIKKCVKKKTKKFFHIF